MMTNWTATKQLDSVLVKYVLESYKAPQRQLYLSDLHLDSKLSARPRVKALLDEALELNAPVHIFGDIFDAMGGKFDKRTSKKDIKEEYNGEVPYFNAIVEDVAAFLAPYGKIIATLSEGNHESKIREIHEFNLLTMLASKIEEISGHRPVVMGWDGFVKTQYEMAGGQGKRRSFVTYFTHGSGGSAPMTFGTLNVKRRGSVYLADVYVSGHVHQAYAVPLAVTQVTDKGRIFTRETLHLQLAGHKEHGGTWEKSKGMHAVPVSGYWVQTTLSNDGLDLLEIRAK